MKIAVVCDSFKGCLTSAEVCSAVKYGINSVLPECEVLSLPFADGGEGTSRCFYENCGGEIIKATVKDSLFRNIETEYTLLPDKTAVIDTAAASGITLLKKDELNPLKASSFGTGELIKDAVSKNADTIILGLGGSATNDGAMGLLSSLGVEFLDENNMPLIPVGENMVNVRRIRLTDEFKKYGKIKFVLACDVDNPFYGENGAAYVFAPQKGADSSAVVKLNNGLRNLCRVYLEKSGVNLQGVNGAGAAGGIAGGMYAVLNCNIKSGFTVLSEAIGLEDKIKSADLVITGEGRTDSQTFFGKLPKRVADIASKYNISCVLLSGDIEDGCDTKSLGFSESFKIRSDGMPLDFAIKNARELLKSKVACIIEKM